MKVVGVSEAKNRLSALIDVVQSGETVLIVDRGRPVARLETASSGEAEGRLARLERAGLVRPATNPTVSNPLPRTKGPRPKAGVSAVEALIEERRSGR